MLQIIEAEMLNSEMGGMWNFIVHDTFVGEACRFWRKSSAFLWNRRFLFGLDVKHAGSPVHTFQGRLSVMSLGIVNFSIKYTCKRTVPTGSAWYTLGNHMQLLSKIWNTACSFPHVANMWSTDFEQRNGRNAELRSAWHIVWWNLPFLKKMHRFFYGTDNFRSALTSNMRRTPYIRFRGVRAWCRRKSQIFTLKWHTQNRYLPDLHHIAGFMFCILLLKFCDRTLPFSGTIKFRYPTGSARICRFSTAIRTRKHISGPPLRKPSHSQLKSHEDCDSLKWNCCHVSVNGCCSGSYTMPNDFTIWMLFWHYWWYWSCCPEDVATLEMSQN